MAFSEFLCDILKSKRQEILRLKSIDSRRALEKKLQSAPSARNFSEALRRPGSFRVIAEMKRVSPSRGVLSKDYHPARLACAYAAGGAAAISVLTDGPFFGGDASHLEETRGVVALPLLRKDFILDDIQVVESRALGADAVLLIVAALTPGELRRLLQTTWSLGMEALVEVHDAAEVRQAVDVGAKVLGINNRDLNTFEIDLHLSAELAAELPGWTVRVSESGIAQKSDMERLARAGYDAFLVGERLVTHQDPAALLKEWLS